MTSPTERPDPDWWEQPVSRRESIWLGIAGAWSVGIFAWMAGFTQFGDQNPVGDTYKISSERYSDKRQSWEEDAEETDEGYLIPPDDSVYIEAMRFSWQPLPIVLDAGKEYDIHLASRDVQHGFSIRPVDSLSQQINLQVFPEREWVVPMTFEDPGTYQVICNEFCGQGHASMQGELFVRDR